MKLSRTGWNNVIIFSVMAIIILINATNDKLFPNEESSNNSEQLILPAHSVILTLSIDFPDNQQISFERVGRNWKLSTKGLIVEKTDQQIEQIMFAWQQSSGLVQAAEIFIENKLGISVKIALAGETSSRDFVLYLLSDQVLIHQQRENRWLALPATFAQQLIPISL
jgi:hypothetical protein